MGFDLGSFLSDAAKAAGDAVQTVEKIPGASDAIKSVAGSVGIDPNVVGAIADAGAKIANASPVISAAGNLGKNIPGFARGFSVGVGTMQTPVDKPQHLAVLRGSLAPTEQHGFDTAVALHLGAVRRPAPPLPPKARAAYQITHGMVGAPVAQKDMMMESIAVDPDARPGAVRAIKEVASDRETLWEKAMGAAGFHGPSDRSNRDYKFGQDDDDGDDGGDGDGGDGDGDGDDDGGGGGGGNGGGGDQQQPPQQPKKKKKHHHGGHHPGGHAGHRPAAPGHHHGDPFPSANSLEAMIVPPGMAPIPASHGWDPHEAFIHQNPHHGFFDHDPHQFHGPPPPLMPPAPEPYGPLPPHPWEHHPWEHRHEGHGGGPDAGQVAANVFDPMHLLHQKPKNVGDVLKNIFDPLHIFGDPPEDDFGKHHKKKHKDQMGAEHHHKKHHGQMGVELPPSARAFGAIGFEVGCCVAGEGASYAGEMQSDPQGHVALYGAQHDPRDWDLTADPLLEINARVEIWPILQAHLDEQQDATAERVSVEGIMP